jgi:hypothetical protein
MTLNRTILLSLMLAVTALAPTAAFARHGADDDPAVADDNGGQRADDRSNSGNRAKQIVRVAGECTGDSTAKLKVKRDRGRLKTEFEVDQNVNGVAWDVKLRRNDKLVVHTTRTTRAPSGSWSIERRIANGAGPDTISAKATSPAGEVCTATATI